MQQIKILLDTKYRSLRTRRLAGDTRHFKIPHRVKLAIRKREQMAVSRWVEKHRVVPADSPVPGYWRNATTPYLPGIMDAVMFPSIQEIVVCAPPQTGKTDLSLNIVGYTADRKPGNWLIVYPDEKTAGDMSRDRVQPMFADSPRLRSYLTGAVDDLAAHRITLKHARIYLAWASSATRLAARPLPYVLLDEIDKYPDYAGKKEAGPIDLARKRTRTFGHMRKILRVSTPTVEAGPIWTALETEAEAVFVYWVKCPTCDAWQQMEFTRIKWDGAGDADPRAILSNPHSTWYECASCGEPWADTDRDRAVAAGEWRDRDEGIELGRYLAVKRPVVVGFHYRAWVSRFVPLREAAAAFLRAQKDKTKLRDFQNDYNAEPWRVYREERAADRVLALVEDRPRGLVPSPGLVSGITAGVDTQDNGFWYWIHAWGFAEPGQRPSSWCLRAGFVTDFQTLGQVLLVDRYADISGRFYVIEMAIQDSAGHRTAEVYDFCRSNPGRIFPSIGKRTMSSPYRWTPQTHYPGAKRVIIGGLQLLNINTQYFKDEAAAALQVQAGDPGAVGLYAGFPADYADQLVAEYIGDEGFWECPPGRDNHLWDCLVLAFAAAEIRGIRHRVKQTQPTNQTQPLGGGPGWIRSESRNSWLKG